MSKVGCVIIEDFKRPDKALVEKFRNVAVANLDDCMNRISAVHEDIRPVNKGKLLGPAFTVKVPSGDNLMFHAAMDLAKPGDVIVIDAGGDTRRSIFGELMVTYCRKRGIAGIVVDGSSAMWTPCPNSLIFRYMPEALHLTVPTKMGQVKSIPPLYAAADW